MSLAALKRPSHAYPWENLVPRHIALEQIRWERSRAMVRAHDECGLTYEQMCRFFNVSKNIIANAVKNKNRISKRAPVQKWLDLLPADLRTLAGTFPIEYQQWNGEAWPW